MKSRWVLLILSLQCPVYNYFKIKVKKCIFYFDAFHVNLKKTQMPNVEK